MSIEVLDRRIKSGVNLTVKNGITYFDVVFYCSNQSDLDYVLPSELYHEAWWAKPYYDNPNVIPKVIDYKITRVIPGADFPCIVSLTAADKLSERFPNVNTGKLDLSDIIRKDFKTISFYWHPSILGMRYATRDDVTSSTPPQKYDNSSVANIGDLIFINYEQDTINYRGSPQLHGSPFDYSVTLTYDDIKDRVGSVERFVVYTVEFYVKTKRIYEFADFAGTNGTFPRKYKPGFDDNNASHKWLVIGNQVETHIDDKGVYWAHIRRKFIHSITASSLFKWNALPWHWKN